MPSTNFVIHAVLIPVQLADDPGGFPEVQGCILFCVDRVSVLRTFGVVWEPGVRDSVWLRFISNAIAPVSFVEGTYGRQLYRSSDLRSQPGVWASLSQHASTRLVARRGQPLSLQL